MEEGALQFRVTLRGVEPAVWRRIQVPEAGTFWGLHVAIQDAMGWEDAHLHRFRVRDPATGIEEQIGVPEGDGDDPGILIDWDVPLVDYFEQESDEALYLYDFGDGWAHDVVFEGRVVRDWKGRRSRCVGGERACPPEDIGGASGYADFLVAMADPDHPQHADLVDWNGGPFDPEAFDPGAVKMSDPDRRWTSTFGSGFD